MRFSIRVKLAIMSIVTIAISVVTLGIFLLVTFNNFSYETASNTLQNVSTNAHSALENSISSIDASLKLLTNQIGYNSDFANHITTVSSSEESYTKVKNAMAGEDGSGDGSTIIGEMDYLIVSSNGMIMSATMYSPFVTTQIRDRLLPTSQSKITFTETTYNRLKEHSGSPLWFYTDTNQLFVWKALVNYGVYDNFEMQVVGYIEYEFDRSRFLSTLSETQYENEGMILLDENNQVVLKTLSGLDSVDETLANDSLSLEVGLTRKDSYTAYKTTFDKYGWKYISYINYLSLEKSNAEGRNVTILIVAISTVISALAATLLSAREIRRIKNLSKAAGSISEGDYTVRLKTTANDEITDVSNSFNIMAKQIQDALNELILQQDSISENFAIILSNKSGESGNHVKRVSEYSAILAEELGFNESDVHDIRIASMLHDVGKIMIDESILHKPGRFTDEEYKIMQQHVVYGGQLLKGVPGNIMKLGAIIAECHHERWDGNGYVQHLKGDEIPKEAQITSLADVFDALVSKRCYKNAWTIEQAFDEIVGQSEKQFAPDVVEAFKRRFDDFKLIVEKYKE